MRASNRLASVSSSTISNVSTSIITSSSALGESSSRQQPSLARAATLRTVDSRSYLVRLTHHATRSNATHRRPSTLPRTHLELPADSPPSRTKGRPSARPPVSPLPLQVPTGISSPQPPGCHKEDAATRRPFSGPRLPAPKTAHLRATPPAFFSYTCNLAPPDIVTL
jgi:hypothetical protein